MKAIKGGIVRAAALSAVLSMAAAILVFSFYFNPVLGDEGVTAMDGLRISNGEVPQRDFFQFIPPLAGYVQALSFRIFQPSVFSVRIVGFLYGILLVFFSFLLYRQFISDSWVLAAILSIFIKYGVAPWFYGSHHWLCDILLICGAWLLVAGSRTGSGVLPAASGAILGLAAFSLQDQGGYAVIGVLLAGTLTGERKLFLTAGMSALCVFAIASIPFAVLAGPSRLIEDWVLFPLVNYKEPFGNRFTISSYWQNFSNGVGLKFFWKAPFYTSSIFVAAVFLFLSPILCPLSLGWIYIRKVLSKKEFLILLVFSLSFLFAAFHRLAMTNLSWAFPAALLPVFIVIDRMAGSGNRSARIAAYSVAGTTIAAMLLFGALRISMLTGETARAVETPRGVYRMLNARDASDLQELVTAVNKNVAEGEPLFATGYIPLVNFMTGHPNPTRFNFMMPGGYYSLEQVSEWNDAVNRKKVIWGVGEKAVFTAEASAKLLPEYEIVFQNRKYMLFRRKAGE